MSSTALADFRRGHPVTRDIPVAWGEMDAFGHVNNIIYFRYFEIARIALFERVGLLEPSGTGGIGPILAATECRFRIPLSYPDTVTAAAWIADLADDRFQMGFAIFSHAHDRIAAEGTGRIVAYDYVNGRKSVLGDEIREKLATLVLGD
jgi:acyl-CoA thioester hydrolase